MYTHLYDNAIAHARKSCTLTGFKRAYEDTTTTQASEPLGTQRIRALRRILNNFSFKRSITQIEFHEAFIQATAQHLYRDDKNVDMHAIMQEQKWNELNQYCLILTPRRFGKTTAVALFVAAYALVVPSAEISIFSTGKRASTKLLELISTIVREQCDAENCRVTKCNGEQLYLSTVTDNVRKVHSYPSATHTLRGVGGDLICLEEAAFMSQDVFNQIVVPLLEMRTTSLLAISTPCGATNFYSAMFEMKSPNGKPFFRQIKVGLACERCIKANCPETCTHNTALIPPWKSQGKLDLVSTLYGERSDLLLQESMGMIAEDSSAMYTVEEADQLVQSKIQVRSSNVHTLFVGVDPTGGGENSEMVMCTTCFDAGKMIVISLDHKVVRGHYEFKEFVIAHIRQLRHHFPQAWIIVFAESNLGQEASHMCALLKSTVNLHFVHEDGKAGVLTTNKRKELYACELKRYMATKCCGVSNALLGSGSLKEVRKQVCSYQKIQTVSARGNVTVSYSGKAQGRDDIAVTLGLIAYWSTCFILRKAPVPYDAIMN